jgi:DNA invertase Pin-like site-specific DNA recombinase
MLEVHDPTPAGRAFAAFLAVFAEFERDLIRERIKAGIMDARKRGTLNLSQFVVHKHWLRTCASPRRLRVNCVKIEEPH